MQYFTFEDDRISMRGEGLMGLPVPSDLDHLESDRLVFDGNNLLDVSTVNDWLIDEEGNKRHPAMHDDKSWQAINCGFDDVIILDAGVWRVEDDADQLVQAKAAAIVGAVQAANGFTASILAKYPEAERAAWPQKQAEAQFVILADNASTSITAALNKTVLLKAMATASSLTNAAVVTLARAIITKADEFSTIAAMVEIMRNSAETAINAASDMAELEAAKLTLEQQATELAVQYGLVG